MPRNFWDIALPIVFIIIAFGGLILLAISGK
jgi:hypothetical protein